MPSFVPSCVTRKQTEKWCAKSNVSKRLSLYCLRQQTSKSSIPKAFAPSRGVHRCSDDVFLMMYSALLNTRYWSQSFTCAMRHSHATSCCVVGHTSQTAKHRHTAPEEASTQTFSAPVDQTLRHHACQTGWQGTLRARASRCCGQCAARGTLSMNACSPSISSKRTRSSSILSPRAMQERYNFYVREEESAYMDVVATALSSSSPC